MSHSTHPQEHLTFLNMTGDHETRGNEPEKKVYTCPNPPPRRPPNILTPRDAISYHLEGAAAAPINRMDLMIHKLQTKERFAPAFPSPSFSSCQKKNTSQTKHYMHARTSLVLSIFMRYQVLRKNRLMHRSE